MRMLGRAARGQCPYCRHGYRPGPDCCSTERSKKQVRADEKRAWTREYRELTDHLT